MKIVHEVVSEGNVVASILIPSSDGDRNGNVALLLRDLKAQRFRAFEIIMVVGVSPQGKAINIAADRAVGEAIIILDDDSRVADVDMISKLMNVVRDDPGIGMAGAAIVQPTDATPFQRRVAREFPRFNMPVADRITDSDMACHGCCVFRREVFKEIGREPEDIVRGLDPVLRRRLRDRGYRVVMVPDLKVSHPVPGSVADLVKMFWRNGRGSAYAQLHNPGEVHDTAEYTEWKGESLHRPLWRRIIGYPFRTSMRLLTGSYIRGLGDLVYALGYAYGLLGGCRGRSRGR
jgi:GT2 family glycosyltransferase